MTGFPLNPPRAAIVDQRGFVSPEWYRYFAQIQAAVGTASGASWQDGYLLAGGPLSGLDASAVQGGGGAITVGTRNIASDYTVTPADCLIRADATSSGITVLAPDPATCPGRVIHCKKVDASVNTVVVVPMSGLIDGAGSEAISAQWDSVSLISNGLTWSLI